MSRPVSIPQCTPYGVMIQDVNPRDGLPDGLKQSAVRKIQAAVDRLGDIPVGGDPYSAEMLKLGIGELRGFGKTLTRKMEAATFGHVRTIDNLQDMPRPKFDAQGYLQTDFQPPPNVRARFWFPVFTKAEQEVVKARWEGLNACSGAARPELPAGISSLEPIKISDHDARHSPVATIEGKTKSGYWIADAKVTNIDPETHTATIALSANRIFTLAGGVGFAPLPPGEKEFSIPVQLDLPIVRLGNWTVQVVNAQSGQKLEETNFNFDPFSHVPVDPRFVS